MIRESFVKNKRLSCFDSDNTRIEGDGYYVLEHDRHHFPHLTLKDTVMHPEGWAEAVLCLQYDCFSEGAELSFCFGKPYANDKAEKATVRLNLTEGGTEVITASGTFVKEPVIAESGEIRISTGAHGLKVNEILFEEVKGEDLCGYLELFCDGGSLHMCGFEVEGNREPYTEEEHTEALIAWRHGLLDQADANLDRLEAYLEEHPEALPEKRGELIVSSAMVDVGEEITVKVISYGTQNAAFAVTKNCFDRDAVTEPYLLSLQKEGEDYCQEFTLKMDVAGNTKLELWVNRERIVRQIAVVAKGYMAVIPWVGSNRPKIDEEIHRYDIPGDYWLDNCSVNADPEACVENKRFFVHNNHKYGDRAVCFINGRTLIPGSETDSLFELDERSQERGLRQLDRQMRILGFDGMELAASYTPDAVAIGIMEKLGVKGMTSLCAWQNWQDGGWKINHCGVSNQPYYPADDDFRRSGEQRDIMCFTMGTSSCNRNYSIMVFDGCPSNVTPGERYFDHRVLHHMAQRFYDVFDSWVADAANNENLPVYTLALESFHGHMDWGAVNDLAVRHAVKRAASEKIIFTSAADVSDYHRRKKLDLQEVYFFQPDTYYGIHNGEMPGRVADRIEAITKDYLAVVRRGFTLPMYFYDYRNPWKSEQFEDTERNEFGLINPDTHLPSECLPRQIYTEDMTVTQEITGNQILIAISSKTAKEQMVTGVFDVPFEEDMTVCADKKDVKIKKIKDAWTGNIHLFVDLGQIPEGDSLVTITVTGTPREPVSAECTNGLFGAMWYNDHAYLRCMDKDSAISVKMKAPQGAYLTLQSGEKIFAENGMLNFTVNKEWFNEAPLLRGYEKSEFEDAIKDAAVECIGATLCSRWSGQ